MLEVNFLKSCPDVDSIKEELEILGVYRNRLRLEMRGPRKFGVLQPLEPKREAGSVEVQHLHVRPPRIREDEE